MTEGQAPTGGEAILTWVQIVAIIGAAAWGAYTFLYEQIWVPATAPVNISIDLQLKKAGVTSSGPMAAIAMHVSATNPSSRRIYLLSTAWFVRGIKLQTTDSMDTAAFDKSAAAKVQSGDYVEKYSNVATSDLVAVGSLFSDWRLNPKETVERTYVIHVPRDKYDAIEATTWVPYVEVPEGYSYVYSIQQQYPDGRSCQLGAGVECQEVITGAMCRQGANDLCTPISSVKEFTKIGGGYERSEAQLSLW